MSLGAIDLIQFLILGLASWRTTSFLIEDHLFEPLRNGIWKRFPPESSRIGYLFTCYRCLGFWIASLVVVSYILVGAWAVLVALPFALSAVVIMIANWLDK